MRHTSLQAKNQGNVHQVTQCASVVILTLPGDLRQRSDDPGGDNRLGDDVPRGCWGRGEKKGVLWDECGGAGGGVGAGTGTLVPSVHGTGIP